MEKDNGYAVVGSRPVRQDGFDKVTGKALYGADIKLPGMLYGKVLRSPHPHARLRRIDASRAYGHPGVRAVVTGSDLPPLPPFGQIGRASCRERV